ncbi:MAG: ATP synthase F0 subunit B [Pseudobdellovibrionaceae bacterium]|nr:ATP synthase F0 subunit B [Bdellovibrionales bacterium]USN46857.1 MAG: ATP synthase F0 subunit B [Pseudobdellovibrionaceae bacterium]
MLANLLASLGINATTGIQFLIFVVVYVFLSQLLFKPYFQAYLERKSRTVGSQDQAERIVAATEELETVYQEKARKFSDSYKRIYDQSRSEALHEHDRLVAEARLRAKAIVEDTRTKVAQEVEKARVAMAAEAPQVSQAIVAKLTGKEM